MWARDEIRGSSLFVCLVLVSAGWAISHLGAPGRTEAQPIDPPAMKDSSEEDVTPMSLAERIRGHAVPTRGMCSILPAHRPADGLLSGNGRMYVEVYGDPLSEHVVFHHERLVKPWIGKPLEAPKIADVLPEVRKLILEGKYREGLEMSLNAAADTETPPRTEPLPEHPAFDMRIQMPEQGAISDYLRTTDFETGEVRVQWKDPSGDWDRRTFVSRPDNAVVQILSAPQGHPLESRIRLDTSPAVGDRGWPHNDELKHFYDPEIRFDRDLSAQRLILQGHYLTESGTDGYASVTRVIPDGGTARVEDGALVVQGARSLLLITRIEWFKNLGSGEVNSLAAAVDDLAPDYAQLLARHRKVQAEVVDRASVDFGGTAQHALSAEEMLIDQKTRTGLSPALMENLFDMGRYWLFLRSGEFPPMWGHININGNLQVSGANAGDLPESMDAFSRWVERLLPDSRTNARNIFGFRGALFSIHPTQREGALTHFDYGWPHHYWVAGGGWLYSPLWDRYLITGDRDYLRTHVLPGLKEIALFYEDYLQQTDERGNYIFVPSYSPENWPDNADGAPTVINANMDIMVCREVLTHLVQASEILGVESENVAKWKAMLAKMPPYLLDTDGSLKEWAWPTLEERLDHRHVSHLYGVWPGDEIDPDRSPQLARAAWLADRTRGQENASAHGLFHRALAAARLKDAYLVNFNLKQVLEQGYVNTSLTTMHNPHRLPAPDAQGALPTLMMEMLVYSRPGVIELLPALPDSLSKGSIRGVMCRTEAKVESLTWDTKSHTVDLTLRSRKRQDLDLIVRYGIESATGPAGVIVDTPRPDADHCRLRLPAGEPVSLHLRIGTHQPSDWIKTVEKRDGADVQ
ncbi:MAG TPA: glycoside hydrolase N-terminal domain-containing protein [Terriglobia bacterium]|nr:glycoside hydrolase N-terminal domain-containing protein [Terriglobia bacterium]